MAFMKAGGDGVISVTANVAPKEFTQMVHFTRDGKLDKAQALHDQMAEIFDVLFIESNPIPVKTALAMKGMMQENFRLPLCEISAEARVKLQAALKNGNWI
jgi:4-hydroxy-tetrahydrodipicolinate synthase